MSDSTPTKQHKVECPNCDSAGYFDIDFDPYRVECYLCKGQGVVTIATLEGNKKAMVLVYPDGKRQYSPEVELVVEGEYLRVWPVVPFVWLVDA